MTVLLDAAGQIIPDLYPPLAESDACPPGGNVLVSLERRLREPESHPASALALSNTANPLDLQPMLAGCPLLVLDFPAFADGRAYSQASLLRRRLGYRGDLRATGQAVVLDQLLMMRSCGFTQFQIREGESVESCQQLLANQSQQRFPRWKLSDISQK